MAHTGTTGGAKIKNLLPRSNVDIVETAENASCELTPERIPYSVLSLDWHSCLVCGALDRDSLLAIDGFSGNKVAGDQKVFLAFCDEDTRVTVRLQDDVCTSFGTSATTPSASSASTPASRCAPCTATASTSSTKAAYWNE
jgi:hypothetical protein